MSIYTSGTLIKNRYEVVQGPIEKRSLAGGMGLVYLCADHGDDGRPVALKTFKPEYLPDRAARERFLREVTTWVEFGRHPHIVRAYRVENIGNGREVYLVLEWIAQAEGKCDASLRAWLMLSKPLPIEQALLFALHITRGMRHATTKIPGFVHRDLKPENVLVGRDSSARVTDFGLAYVLQGQSESLIRFAIDQEQEDQSPKGHTQLTWGVVGTPEYMAPEQWERRDIDMRADIYALGCILVEMLTGQMPVKANPRKACLHLHQSGQALKATQDLPEVVKPLLARCLAVIPDDRYADWGEVEVAVASVYRAAVGKDAPPQIGSSDENRTERVAAGWSYLAIGGGYYDINKYDLAIQCFKRTLALARVESQQRLEHAALVSLGLAYYTLGHVEEAVRTTKQALVICSAIGDQEGEGKALDSLGACYIRLGRIEDAVNALEQSLVITQHVGDRHCEGMVLSKLGNCYRVLGRLEKAINVLQQALVILHEIDYRQIEGGALSELGICYFENGQIADALRCHEQYLSISREIADQLGEGNALTEMGNCYLQMRRLTEAERCYQQALSIYREINYSRGEADALGNLGICNFELGRLDETVKVIQEQLAITREIGDRLGEGNALGNLGNAYHALGDVHRAIGYYEQHLVIARELGNKENLWRSLVRQGYILSRLGDLNKAMPLYEEAERICRELGNVSVLADYLYKFGRNLWGSFVEATDTRAGLSSLEEFESGTDRLLRVSGYPDIAIKVFQKTIQLNKYFAEAHYMLGLVLEFKGRLDDAIDAYENALELKPDWTDVQARLGSLLVKKENKS